MENYIDLINAYLNKTLSKTEVLAFENKLQSDAEFTLIYNEHLDIINGLKRVKLKQEINEARRSYVRGKWFKYLGISLGIIIVSILAYSLISTSQNSVTSDPSENNAVEFVSDSIRTKQIEVVETITDTILTEKVISETKLVTTAETVVDEVIDEKKKKDSKTSIGNDLISFFKSVKKEAQKITVNTAEDFKITLKEGTIISIPKNAFIDEKTGKQVFGNIELNVTEYYKLSDMLLADLSTISDDKILETGGMLNIEARKNESKLRLYPEVKINIGFNGRGKTNMQLFEGEKDDANKINWTLNEPEVTFNEVATVDTLTGRFDKTVLSFNLVEKTPVFPGCVEGNNKVQKECFSTAINKIIERKFNPEIAENLNYAGNHKINASFNIDEEGNIVNIVAKAYRKELAEEAIRVIETFPKVKPAFQSGKPVTVKYILPLTYRGSSETKKQNRRLNKVLDSSLFTLRSDKKFVESFEASIEGNVGNIKVKESDIERYAFAISQLGWINCDRFVNSKKRKIKFKIKIKDSEGANVKMVFKSMSSILPSYRIDVDYSFGEIPIGEDVILFAIKKKDNKLFLGMKEVTTKALTELDLEFKEVTIVELKKELRKLNKDFQ